jgi:hypothetical protein
MRHLIVCALALLVLAPVVARAEPPGTPGPVATGTPSGLPTPNPDAIAAAARRCFLELQAGKIDRQLLTAGASVDLSADAVKDLERQLHPLGRPSAFVLAFSSLSGNTGAYIYRVTSADGRHYVIFSYSVDVAQNKVTALHFGPTSRI